MLQLEQLAKQKPAVDEDEELVDYTGVQLICLTTCLHDQQW